MPPLEAILITDGRPGHEKQSKGILQALGSLAEVKVQQFTVEKLSPVAEAVASLRFALGFNVSPCRVGKAHLVIGTGSRTHLPVLSCAKRCQAKAVTCMTPASVLRPLFDLYFPPIHDRVKQSGNLFETVGPPNMAVARHDHDLGRGLILVGGPDPASHVWRDDSNVDNIDRLLRKTPGITWTIASSPRTPKKTESMLDDLANRYPSVQFVPFAATQPGWIELQYSQNKTVWITADSISMVYEALSAGCRVGILPVQWTHKATKFKFSERYLIQNSLAVGFSDWLNGSVDWRENEPLKEAERCAREILRRWWPESLQ